MKTWIATGADKNEWNLEFQMKTTNGKVDRLDVEKNEEIKMFALESV